MTREPAFEPDGEVFVVTKTPDDARKFFGAPPHWPVRVVEQKPDGLYLYAVQAVGLDLPQ